MRHYLSCVGLVIFLGSFSFVVVPDDDFVPGAKVAHIHKEALPTVIIDPGHGGNDEGAVANGLREKDLTLDVARRVEQNLRAYNFSTLLTRQSDTYVSLPARAGMANKTDNALFISIHFNQSNQGFVTGAETFYADQKISPESSWTWVGLFNKPEPQPLDNGETLAGFIQASLVMKIEAQNRGIKGRNLYVVRHVKCPSVLVEGGFLSNPIEAQLLKNNDYKDRLAAAIAEGVLNYQKTIHSPTPPSKLANTKN